MTLRVIYEITDVRFGGTPNLVTALVAYAGDGTPRERLQRRITAPIVRAFWTDRINVEATQRQLIAAFNAVRREEVRRASKAAQDDAAQESLAALAGEVTL